MITSRLGQIGFAGVAHYSAAKAGMIASRSRSRASSGRAGSGRTPSRRASSSRTWDAGPERAPGLIDFVKRIEALGFDSVFVTDHLLAATQFYSASFLEPLSTLAVCAGATERIRLGTSVLVAAGPRPGHPCRGAVDTSVPLRQPVHPRRRAGLEPRPSSAPRAATSRSAAGAPTRSSTSRSGCWRARRSHTTAGTTTSKTCRSSPGRSAARCSGWAAAPSSPTRSRLTCRASPRLSSAGSFAPTAGSRGPPARRR